MQLTMTSKTCMYKTAATLRDDLYRGDDVMLLDCRSNEEYKRNHIKHAFNISLPQLMMRRLKSNKLSLEKLVPPNFRNEKDVFLQRCLNHTVLLYDQYSTDINSANENSLLVLLQRRMVHEKCKVFILKGGFAHFQSENPEFCVSSSTNDEEDEYSGDSSGGSHSDDSTGSNSRLSPNKDSNGVTPLLGLGSLSINCEASKSPTVKSLGEIPGSLHARRAKRRMQKQISITIGSRNSEGESEHSSSANSSDGAGQSDIVVLSPLNCNNNKIHPVQLIDDCKSPHNYPNFGNGNSPVEILPYLFLGCHKDATSKETLNSHNISYVLNVTPNLPNVFEDDKSFHYKKIAISDHWSQNLSQFFPEAIAFIDEARERQCGVLVHCLAGISRSVTVTVAYLMQKERWTLNDAYDFVKQRKSNVSPNFNFMGQLLDFEKQLGLNATDSGCDSGIASSSSSSSSTSPPTLFFTSPPPPTPTPVTTNSSKGANCGMKSGVSPIDHRGMFCLPTPMS